MVLYAVPMHGDYSVDTNFTRYFDGLFLTGHMWSRTKVWDPEGLWSTLPAISTMLFGVITGHWMRAKSRPLVGGLLAGGVALFLAGLALSSWIPINKNLWTPSYAILMSGLAAIVFGVFYWLMDVRGWKRWAMPLVIYGSNAITVFMLSGFIARVLSLIRPGGVSLASRIYRSLFQPFAAPINASLLYALAWVLAMFLITWALYRKKLFVRL